MGATILLAQYKLKQRVLRRPKTSVSGKPPLHKNQLQKHYTTIYCNLSTKQSIYRISVILRERKWLLKLVYLSFSSTPTVEWLAIYHKAKDRPLEFQQSVLLVGGVRPHASCISFVAAFSCAGIFTGSDTPTLNTCSV